MLPAVIVILMLTSMGDECKFSGHGHYTIYCRERMFVEFVIDDKSNVLNTLTKTQTFTPVLIPKPSEPSCMI